MTQQTEQFQCECGKQFTNRAELEKHRRTCTKAQSGIGTGGGQTRGAGSGSQTNE
jgi:hypothetical protein